MLNVYQGGPFNQILSLAVYNDELVAGGRFQQYFPTASGYNAAQIARFNGTSWFTLGCGEDNGLQLQVEAMTIYAGDLVAGATYYRDAPSPHWARWGPPDPTEGGAGSPPDAGTEPGTPCNADPDQPTTQPDANELLLQTEPVVTSGDDADSGPNATNTSAKTQPADPESATDKITVGACGSSGSLPLVISFLGLTALRLTSRNAKRDTQ